MTSTFTFERYPVTGEVSGKLILLTDAFNRMMGLSSTMMIDATCHQPTLNAVSLIMANIANVAEEDFYLQYTDRWIIKIFTKDETFTFVMS